MAVCPAIEWWLVQGVSCFLLEVKTGRVVFNGYSPFAMLFFLRCSLLTAMVQSGCLSCHIFLVTSNQPGCSPLTHLINDTLPPAELQLSEFFFCVCAIPRKPWTLSCMNIPGNQHFLKYTKLATIKFIYFCSKSKVDVNANWSSWLVSVTELAVWNNCLYIQVFLIKWSVSVYISTSRYWVYTLTAFFYFISLHRHCIHMMNVILRCNVWVCSSSSVMHVSIIASHWTW